jgi:hypothetical protein
MGIDGLPGPPVIGPILSLPIVPPSASQKFSDKQRTENEGAAIYRMRHYIIIVGKTNDSIAFF